MEPLSGIPFMMAGIVGQKINNTRLAEAVIIAIVSSVMMAGFGYFIAFPVMQEQVKQIKDDLKETKETVKEAFKENKAYQEGRRSLRDAETLRTDEKIRQIQIEIARMKR